jgi:RHS repeat-associated protein
LNVSAFLGATVGSWQMTGDIADYYRGQPDVGGNRSDDQGYPYWGVLYEASPRSVQLETSLPGAASAINLAVPATSRQTVQYTYTTNAAAVGSMPASQYSETRITSPIKTVCSQLTDRLGQQVVRTFLDGSGATANRSTGARTYSAPASGPTVSLVQQLPNAQMNPPQTGTSPFVRTLLADGCQRLSAVTDPDTATTSFLYDSTGQLRFVQPALGPGEQWYVYYCYDALGRRISEGTVAGAWDPVSLARNADIPSWPISGSSGLSVTTTVSTQYDGTGSDPTLIGMLCSTTTNNPAPASLASAGSITVTEQFTYGLDGNLHTARQTVSGAVSANNVIGYAYNALGELVRVDLPSNCPITSIYYTYDDHGDVVAVGKTTGGSELGAFGYSAERQLQSFAVAKWNRTITYTSQGWVQSMVTSSTSGSQSFSLNYSYLPDGEMSARQASYAFTNYALAYNDTFSFDNQRRLSGASGSSNLASISYDPNGNLLSLTHNGKVSSFTGASTSNHIATASIEGGAPTALTWNARGQLVSGLGRNLEYVPDTGRTRAITTSTAQVALSYGGVQQRVVKQNLSTGAVNVYFFGDGNVPLAWRVNGKWGVLVPGPMGPIAWISDQTYTLLTDLTGSVWGAVTDTGLSFATAWTPYGTVGASYGDATLVPLGYQGHEWDTEVGLHNFHARQYDPMLCRFLSPDPRCQFTSPYVMLGNSPLTAIDPTGELSLLARIGIGLAMGGVALAGLALTVATGGASDAAAFSIEEGLAASMTAAETCSGAGAASASVTVAGASTTDAVAALAGPSAGIMGTGAATTAAGCAESTGVAAGTSVTFNATTVAQIATQVLGHTLMGAGTAGLQYDARHGRSFTAKGFGEAVGIAAATSAATALVGGVMSPFLKPLTAEMQGWRLIRTTQGIAAFKGMCTGAVGATVNTLLTNAAQHQPLYHNLAENVLKGATKGASKGWGKAGSKQSGAGAAQAARSGIIKDQTAAKFATMTASAKAPVKTDAFSTSVLAATYFVGMGWLMWGASTGGD